MQVTDLDAIQPLRASAGDLAAVLAALHALDDDQIHTVIGQAKAVLDERAAAARAAETEQRGAGGQDGKGRHRAGATVELKMINGYGPYAYKRWWDRGHHRSEYIGKVEE
jgi:hypothetical protein